MNDGLPPPEGGGGVNHRGAEAQLVTAELKAKPEDIAPSQTRRREDTKLFTKKKSEPSQENGTRMNADEHGFFCGWRMRIFAAVATLVLFPVVVLGGCSDCPPMTDWAVVEELWWILVDDPSEDVGSLILEAFSVGSEIPADRSTLIQAVTESEGPLVAAIAEKQSWAIQLGLRLATARDLPFRAELQLALGDVATSDPEIVLRELDMTYDATTCGGFFHGFVQCFGTVQEVRDGATPLLKDVEARIEALSSVEDPGLIEVRDWCVGLLEVQAGHIRDSTLPRMLRRVNIDLSSFYDRPPENLFVAAEATIGTDGKVAAVRILRGIDEEVNEVVSEALTQLVFEPKIEKGEAVEFKYIMTVRPHFY